MSLYESRWISAPQMEIMQSPRWRTDEITEEDRYTGILRIYLYVHKCRLFELKVT